ncbi:hypothetical protein FB45DRAFT_138746 [Roridomyces roridus]|uniref:Uncharacterized protein n=1 Tax=Roridomyces roridus TaxID=1738132 RepID=A0AAD7BHU1_9AGAR|nr:hypothetical protein FB45DRAFT_138746 [Roridomyces roridus]
MLSVTLAHEIMHLLDLLAFPEWRMKKTPPGVDDEESGFKLEAGLCGGYIRVSWENEDDKDQMAKISHLTFRERFSKEEDPDALLAEHVQEWFDKLAQGEIMEFSAFKDVTNTQIPVSMGRRRGPRNSSRSLPGGYTTYPLKPGQVSMLVGARRAPSNRPYTYEDQQADIAGR